MKQAILITAYKNIDHLIRMVDFFNNDYSFYIHIDQKSKLSDEKISILKNNPKVKLLSRRYKVNWGSIQHLEAILLLARKCIENKDAEYIHLITGQDFPIKTPKQISEFLQNNSGTEFMTGQSLPHQLWKNGGADRIYYYSPYEVFNGRNWQRIFIKAFVLLQKAISYKRELPASLPLLYGGSTYWTLTSSAVEYIIDYLNKNKEILSAFRYTFCSEEILLHTILMNSPYKDNIRQNSLRFIEWKHRDGISPANLDERDYDNIMNSDALFARKFEYPVSEKLYEKLIEALK
ncbi:beta-1,6-N-acetylglucosaminyltransferase [Dysgonomonas sp. BGC7]|uniref:beta-1,6-N-acetylglucosaminyltransferase n=1 Tax=Dysgonomonas sp. BGC7 TaxID=1658008 RepID=UPI000680EE53|nr:beta-1,6-N-acetylglucosaminyltransferase [Dysgonomonas sp. BGC7]MBD8389745.1 hypothetical protein [Dysgonomonas sp. BGC7]